MAINYFQFKPEMKADMSRLAEQTGQQQRTTKRPHNETHSAAAFKKVLSRVQQVEQNAQPIGESSVEAAKNNLRPEEQFVKNERPDWLPEGYVMLQANEQNHSDEDATQSEQASEVSGYHAIALNSIQTSESDAQFIAVPVQQELDSSNETSTISTEMSMMEWMAQFHASLDSQQKSLPADVSDQLVKVLNVLLAGSNGGQQIGEQDLLKLQQLYAKLMKLLNENAEVFDAFKQLQQVLDGLTSKQQMKEAKPSLPLTITQLVALFEQSEELKNSEFVQTVQRMIAQLSAQTTQNTQNAQNANQQQSTMQTLTTDSVAMQAVAADDQAAVQAKSAQDVQPTLVANGQTTATAQAVKSAEGSQQQQQQQQQFQQELKQFAMKNFRIIQQKGFAEARFTLNPEQLGQVNVKISMQNGQVVAQLLTDNPIARETLESQLSQLRSSLQNSGLQVDKLEVLQQQSQHFQEQRRNQTAWQQQNKDVNKVKPVYFDGVETSEQSDTLVANLAPKLSIGSSFDVTA